MTAPFQFGAPETSAVTRRDGPLDDQCRAL